MSNGPPPVGSPLWTVPLMLGGLIFLFGVMILVVPELLAYLVAFAFCVVGLSIMGMGWRMRPRGGGGGGGGGGTRRSGTYVDFRVDREE